MSTSMELVQLYEMILSLPGMNEEVKISMKVNRKNVLFLSKVIEMGLKAEAREGKELAELEIIAPDTRQELQLLNLDLLQKAGLTEIHQKLQQFYNSPSSAKLK